LRLVGGVSQREGRVEICLNQQWGTICGKQWSNEDAQVVCRQLTLPTIGNPQFSIMYTAQVVSVVSKTCVYLLEQIGGIANEHVTSQLKTMWFLDSWSSWVSARGPEHSCIIEGLPSYKPWFLDSWSSWVGARSPD
jgi:hypothetical protein